VQDVVHKTLLKCGFRYVGRSELKRLTSIKRLENCQGCYLKSYKLEQDIFNVALSLQADVYTELPTATILELPHRLKGRLVPHVAHEYHLCYVDTMEANWDPNDLEGLYKGIDNQIESTLRMSVASFDSDGTESLNVRGELASYWDGREYLHVLFEEDQRKDLSARAVRKIGSLARQGYVSYSNSQSGRSNLTRWLELQWPCIEYSDSDETITHCLDVEPKCLAGVAWPPEDFKEVVSWLEEVDISAFSRLVQAIKSSKITRRVIVLNVKNNEPIAFYVKFDVKALDLKRHSGPKGGSHKTLVLLLRSKRSVQSFVKLSVVSSSKSAMLSRNLPRPQLADMTGKRIALLGCGTVGGYLANLLVRNGFGCGSSRLDLYDPDVLKPVNFGRHILSAQYFGLNKAKATAKYLSESAYIVDNVSSFGGQFPINVSELKKYDIVIDATGRPPVSKRLARVMREILIDQRPVLVHVYNDGYGRASKVFIDKGQACYGCLVSDPATHKKEHDLRFLSYTQVSQVAHGCGGTYMPYDAAVSCVSASLAQEAVMFACQEILTWTYKEHIFEGGRSAKPRTIRQQSACDVCS